MTEDEIKEAATRLGCWAKPYAIRPKSEAYNLAVVALVQEAVKAEREACAAICLEMAKRSGGDIRTVALEVATERIQARGQ
jgi:hypothetical protein